jgi:hypothetical protein
MSHSWSPADLGRQRRLVRGIALRAEMDRRVLENKRRELKARVLGKLSSPVGLAFCFAAGFVIAMAPWPKRARSSDDGDASGEAKRHPLRLLLGAFLWFLRRQAQFKAIKQRMAPSEQPMMDSGTVAAVPPSESIH